MTERNSEFSSLGPGQDLATPERPIGSILSEIRNLEPSQVERILEHQKQSGKRFGEAAIDLGFASHDEVLFALAQQFHYPYAPEAQRLTNPELVMLNKPFGVQAESFRAIRSQLTLRLDGEHAERRALAVVSPQSGDGKTFFTANLAIALAQLGGRVLLVDADMRHPRQHEVFGLENKSGLSSVLSGRSGSRVIQHVQGVANLFLLPVGPTPPNPLELVERPAFALLLREVLSKFDHVVVDTPAAVYGSDSAMIAARCGAALVVARRGKGRIAALQDLVGTLMGTNARLAGTVYNDF